MNKRAYKYRDKGDGKFDEFLAWKADVHVETMNDGHIWIGVYDSDGNYHHLNFHARGNTIKVTAEREDRGRP